MVLNTRTKQISGVMVVQCGGAIVFGEDATSLRLLVKDLLNLNKCRQIVLDLGEVTRMDSGGLGTLVGLYTSVRNVGGEIKLANPGTFVNELLQMTKLATVFDVFEKTEDAIASFNRAAAAN